MLPCNKCFRILVLVQSFIRRGGLGWGSGILFKSTLKTLMFYFVYCLSQLVDFTLLLHYQLPVQSLVLQQLLTQFLLWTPQFLDLSREQLPFLNQSSHCLSQRLILELLIKLNEFSHEILVFLDYLDFFLQFQIFLFFDYQILLKDFNLPDHLLHCIGVLLILGFIQFFQFPTI